MLVKSSIILVVDGNCVVSSADSDVVGVDVAILSVTSSGSVIQEAKDNHIIVSHKQKCK